MILKNVKYIQKIRDLKRVRSGSRKADLRKMKAPGTG